MYEECVQDILYLIYQISMTDVHLFQAYSLSKGAVAYQLYVLQDYLYIYM